MKVKEEGFRFELDASGVATITLDRPDRINALTFASYAALRDCFVAIHGDRSVRSVVLRGEPIGQLALDFVELADVR